MENAAEALKMAGAAALFVIAFTITIMMFTRARTTTDAVLARLNSQEYMQTVTGLDNNITREVGIETVIPTLYKYGDSDTAIQIRILDTAGNELQVFDSALESNVASAIDTPVADRTPYQKAIIDKYHNTSKQAYMFGVQWLNQDNDYKLERINAYIYGTRTAHMPTVDYSTISYKGLLKTIKDLEDTNPTQIVKFLETYDEYNISGTIDKDEYGEEIVIKPASTKTIITYKMVLKNKN